MNQSFNVERPFMFKRVFLVALAIVALGAVTSYATNVQLTATADNAAGTWQVSMTMADAQNLGLSSFSIDVMGTNGANILRAQTVANTNGSPNPPFLSLRTNGTVSGSNVLGIAASQDVISAVNNVDDSG